MIRVLLDQGIPRSTSLSLPVRDWDILHVSECGLSLASDREIIAFALANARVICTLDADFHALLAVSGAVAPSVIRIRREGLRAPELAGLLTRIWQNAGSAITAGALVTATDRAIRIRRLPIIPV